MVSAFDPSGDYQYLDNPLTLTHISVRNSGNVSASWASCQRAQVTVRDMAGGVYTPTDVVFNLPHALLTYTPKPGDTLTDSDSVVWTILTLNRTTERAWWRCVCRDFVLAADLRDSVDILAPTNATDAAGSRVPGFGPKRVGLNGRYQPNAGSREDVLGQRTTVESGQVFIAEDVDVTNEDQVVVNNVIYQVVRWQNKSRVDELMVIDVERIR